MDLIKTAESPEEHNIPAAIATVARSERDGTPTVLEVDGVLYQRPSDQARARTLLEQSQRWDQVLAYGVPRELLTSVELDISGRLIDESRDCMRRIGHLLVFHGQHELWRLAYLEYVRGCTYALGDETLFLFDEPTSGTAGYNGPPADRFTTAIEQGAQLARQQNGG
jgi:hypothetical protein